MTPSSIYLSGPMSGIPEHNFPAFARAAQGLRSQGLSIVSPHELADPSDGSSWSDYLRRDIVEIATKCSQIALLPGWEKSAGAVTELSLCLNLGLQVSLLGEDKGRFFLYWHAGITAILESSPAGELFSHINSLHLAAAK